MYNFTPAEYFLNLRVVLSKISALRPEFRNLCYQRDQRPLSCTQNDEKLQFHQTNVSCKHDRIDNLNMIRCLEDSQVLLMSTQEILHS